MAGLGEVFQLYSFIIECWKSWACNYCPLKVHHENNGIIIHRSKYFPAQRLQ